MPVEIVFLWTDMIYWLLVVALMAYILKPKSNPVRKAWDEVWHSPVAMSTVVIIAFYMFIAFIDSIHFSVANSNTIVSVLDMILSPLDGILEVTYSAPFSDVSFVKESSVPKALNYPNPDASIGMIILKALGVSALIYALMMPVLLYFVPVKSLLTPKPTDIRWRTAFGTLFICLFIAVALFMLSRNFHILGTDKVGQDVFYQSVKSIRTGVLIGTLTTLVLLPFAIIFGTLAGYFRGWVDDVIQYVYTVLSSIPNVLLIVAAVLMLEILMSKYPDAFSHIQERADIRLLALCIILGVTSWTSLCRLLRAETLKLRDQDYVKAAVVMGVSHHKLIAQHIVPNLMHIVFITVALDFSALVLTEAVLSYVGVGVDPSMFSWGNMINTARLELARDPVVWWSLASAFVFMFTLVLAANLFADKVQQAFDPRARVSR